jgi:methyl-accepting chemotaxis protein
VKFADITIRSRLWLMAGLLMALILIMACLGIFRLAQLNRQMNVVIHEIYPKTMIAAQTVEQLNVAARGVRNALLLEDEPLIQAELDQVNAAFKINNQILQKLDALLLDARSRQQLSQLQQVRGDYAQQIEKILRDVRSGQKQEAIKALLIDLPPKQKAYLNEVNKLITLQQELMKNAAADVSEDYRSARLILICAVLVGMVGGICLTWNIARGITQPLNLSVTLAQAVANGDLSKSIDSSGHDETARLQQALKSMVENLRTIVAQVQKSSLAIDTGSAEITQEMRQLSARTEDQAASLEETAASMEQFTATVKLNSEHAHHANELTDSALSVARQGGESVNQMTQTMTLIHESSRKIVDIIGVIDSIAFQTNILALNAAVEAARAGEQGRGFAVVASEVRALAQHSASAAKQIKGLIDDSVEKVALGSKLAEQTGITMHEVVNSVEKVSRIIADISSASQEQRSGIEQINQAVIQMDQVTQQNAAMVEQTVAATQTLQDLATRLGQLVGVFRLGHGPQAEHGQLPSSALRGTGSAAPRPALLTHGA